VPDSPEDRLPRSFRWVGWGLLAAVVLLLGKACLALNPTDAAVAEVERTVGAIEGVAEVEVSGINDIVFHTVLSVSVTMEPDAEPSSLVEVSTALGDIADETRAIPYPKIFQRVHEIPTTVDTIDQHPEYLAGLRHPLAAALAEGGISLSGDGWGARGEDDYEVSPYASVHITTANADPATLIDQVLDVAEQAGVPDLRFSITLPDAPDPIVIDDGAWTYREAYTGWIDRNGADCVAAIRAAGVRPTGVHIDEDRAFVWVTDPDVVVLVTGTPMPGDPATDPTAVPTAGQAGS
jgi:hypothetical protein